MASAASTALAICDSYARLAGSSARRAGGSAAGGAVRRERVAVKRRGVGASHPNHEVGTWAQRSLSWPGVSIAKVMSSALPAARRAAEAAEPRAAEVSRGEPR